MQNQIQSRIGRSHAFPRAWRRLRVFASFSLVHCRLLWSAIVIALVLVLQHSIEQTSLTRRLSLIRKTWLWSKRTIWQNPYRGMTWGMGTRQHTKLNATNQRNIIGWRHSEGKLMKPMAMQITSGHQCGEPLRTFDVREPCDLFAGRHFLKFQFSTSKLRNRDATFRYSCEALRVIFIDLYRPYS